MCIVNFKSIFDQNLFCFNFLIIVMCYNLILQLDSGGPIQIKNNDNPAAYTLIGLITFGDHCKNRLPDVYLNITPFIPWIESIVWPPECVNCDSGVYDYRQWG